MSAARGVGPLERGVAALGLACAAPLMAAAAVAIKSSSPGPVLYRAVRIGQGGRPFTMYKLRTMHLGAAEAGAITGGADVRVFRAGRWLRRLKLDEVPQLWNVCRGEMSFVGPRPEDPAIVRDHYAPWMRESLEVAPGVVGPGSLSYYLDEADLPDEPAAAASYYVDVVLPRKIARDLVYVRGRSTAYTAQLLLRTGLGIVRLGHLADGLREREERAATAVLRSVGAADPAAGSSPAQHG